MKESLVFINQSSGYLMVDIINAHRLKYRQRVLLTGKLVQRNIPLDSSVTVERVIAFDRASTVRRLFTWMCAWVKILFLVKTKYRKSDLFIVSNPPFATLLPLFCKNKYHLLLFDIYPDALVEYKILKKESLLVRLWSWANKKVYANAENIFTLSDGMTTLTSKYAQREKIRVVSIWTDNSFLKPLLRKENSFISKHRLHGKFIVMYSGNLGHTHDIEALVECALKISDSNVMFVVIGEGEKRKMLEQMMKANRLENFLLLPLQDIDTFPLSLAAADLGVVTLGKQASLLSVPSKTYNLLSVGAPLLCIASQESELSSLVSHYELGKCFDAIEVDAMVEFIERVASDTKFHQKLRSNALNASKAFGPENALKLVV